MFPFSNAPLEGLPGLRLFCLRVALLCSDRTSLLLHARGVIVWPGTCAHDTSDLKWTRSRNLWFNVSFNLSFNVSVTLFILSGVVPGHHHQAQRMDMHMARTSGPEQMALRLLSSYRATFRLQARGIIVRPREWLCKGHEQVSQSRWLFFSSYRATFRLQSRGIIVRPSACM